MTIDETTNDAQDLESTEVEATPEQVVPEARTIAEATSRASNEMQAILDLSTAQKVKLDGKEYSISDMKEWQKNGLRQSDYTRKTQELAAERKKLSEEYEPYKKYSGENLLADLMKIKSNPELIPQFKEIYGDKYAPALDLLGLTNQEKRELKQEMQSSGLDPQTRAELDEVLSLGRTLKERESQAMAAELDARFSEMSKKYPHVDEEMAMTRLESLAAKKGTLEPQDYEAVYSQMNKRMTEIADSIYKSKVTAQKNRNAEGADVRSGGGIPGNAPKQPRTIKEAQDLALQAIMNQQ